MENKNNQRLLITDCFASSPKKTAVVLISLPLDLSRKQGQIYDPVFEHGV